MTESNSHLTDAQKKIIPMTYSHTDLYGKYALAFSKRWGEESRLQPIHYLTDHSECVYGFSEMLKAVLLEEDVLDVVSDTMINWLCYFKPLRGKMKRTLKNTKQGTFQYEISKNFHDEHEWRFVPFNVSMKELKNKQDVAQ